MAFIVENGDGIENANSLASVEFADEYFSSRPANSWSEYTESEKQKHLVAATDYVNSRFKYLGHKLSENQGCEFPRTRVGMPVDILKATCEMALRSGNGLLMPDVNNLGFSLQSKKVKAGPTESSKTYATGIENFSEYINYPAADSLLRKYSAGSSSFINR